LGTLKGENKSKLLHKDVWVCFVFFDSYCTGAKQNKKCVFLLTNDNRTKEKKLFPEVFMSFFFLYLSHTFLTKTFKVFIQSFFVSQKQVKPKGKLSLCNICFDIDNTFFETLIF
jgi:hypothetical protein